VAYSAADKLHEVEREIAMRKRVYPSMIVKGSLSEAAAQRQIAILREIAEDYRESIVAAAKLNVG
jgi:hypothetical protein